MNQRHQFPSPKLLNDEGIERNNYHDRLEVFKGRNTTE